MTTPPRIVSASAGTGKTHRLTSEVVASCRSDAAAPARLAGLVAVTYTRRAHAELASRIRQALVAGGAHDEALRLPLAYVGTVHAVCLGLLEELAIDAGLSPFLDVLADDGGRRFQASIESCVDAALLEELDQLARRLQISQDARIQRHDWARVAREIMELARGNRTDPDALPAMAARSSAGLLALLPAPEGTADALDDQLRDALAGAIARLEAGHDDTKKTSEEITRLRGIEALARRGPLPWSAWVRAAATEPGKRCRAAVAELVAVASRYERHPRLHDDLRRFTAGVFEVARRAMTGYAAWKARRRVVDYADMIDRALQLVEERETATELAERLDLVVVDELQDTSPLQLALFVRLHQLAGRSVWVGDAKQCIFEYAGADPLLMDAVTTWATRAGAPVERLADNYRSRRELVALCSEVFARAFERHGWPGADVRTTATRPLPGELVATPPLGVWWLQSRSIEDDAAAIAAGVRRLLASPEATRVVDRATGAVRPVEPRDVGVLVATNDQGRAIARHLQACGVRAAVAREGLMSTPEGTLVDAALRWLVDPGDRLSRAVIDALGGWGNDGPDAWLGRTVRGEETDPPWLAPLAAVRARLTTLTPAEVLDLAIQRLDAITWCASWPDADQRLGNLEALRALASAYEERCARHREAATVAGLVRYMQDARRTAWIRGEERASDDQLVVGGDQVVTVCTYHKAKGLEWPVVVLASLDREGRRDAFDPCPETDSAQFDPDRPLDGRWIRYWPWPFGQAKRVPLAEAAAAAEPGRRVALREARERLRLLYVGFTRARDHLVLAARATAKGPQHAWLDELRDDAGELLRLPFDAADGTIASVSTPHPEGRAATTPCRVWRLSPGEAAPAPHRPRFRFARRASAVQVDALPAYRILPSRPDDRAGAPPLRAGEVSTIGPGLSFPAGLVGEDGTAWDTIGTAVHAFLAADPHDDDAARLELADRILSAAGLHPILRPDRLLRASDSLRTHVDTRWPGASWTREVPITALIETPAGRRRIEGTIDLLVETAEGVHVIDHKTFPATEPAALRRRAAELAPQLATYADALDRCGHRVAGCHLHFPAAGAWVELRRA